MWRSGTFDLEDINEALMEEIVFFEISYPGMVGSGCVIFITKRGDEYIISQQGTDWHIVDIVKLFQTCMKHIEIEKMESWMGMGLGLLIIGK